MQSSSKPNGRETEMAIVEKNKQINELRSQLLRSAAEVNRLRARYEGQDRGARLRDRLASVPMLAKLRAAFRSFKGR